MTQEQEQVFLEKFDKFIDETRKNFGQLFEDRQSDYKHFDKRTEDIFLLMGQLRNEAHIMTDKVGRATETVENKTHEMQETVAGVVETVEDKLDTSTTKIEEKLNSGMNNVTETLKSKHMFDFIRKTVASDPARIKKPSFFRRLWPFGNKSREVNQN